MNKHLEYPPYYKPVFVKYKIKGTNIVKTQKMWLAVNDHGDYIWTDAANDTHVWNDGLIEVINWWDCSTNGVNIDSTKSF
jgi:hypothetical protein